VIKTVGDTVPHLLPRTSLLLILSSTCVIAEQALFTYDEIKKRRQPKYMKGLDRSDMLYIILYHKIISA
jgi:hypothetical protein